MSKPRAFHRLYKYVQVAVLFASVPATLLAVEAKAQTVPDRGSGIFGGLTQGRPDNRAGDIELVTKNRNLEELSRELARIYLTLHNSRRLSVKRVTVDGDENIEGVFRRNNLFYGKGFPLEIDSLACDLNTHVCRREKIPASDEQQQSLTGHVSKSLPSRGEWRLTPTISLLLPDVELRPDTEWFTYTKLRSTSLEFLVVNELGGCTSFDSRCKSLIAFYNRTIGEKIFEDEYRGPVSLPVLTVSVTTNAATAAEAPKPDNPVAATTREDRPEEAITLQPLPSPKGESSYKVIKMPPSSAPPEKFNVDDVVKQLHNNVITNIKPKIFDVTQPMPGAVVFPQDLEKRRDELARLIAFPLKHPYPPDYQAGVPIGVLDSRVDERHCALDYTRITVKNFTVQSEEEPRANCDLQVKGNEEADHGTHVIGIISAQKLGLNPYAKIVAMEIDFSGPNSDQIARDLKQLVQDHRLPIVNMSFGYLISAQNPDLQPADVLERPIAGLENTTLFVAAAGNAGADKSYICDIRPACFDLPNVIAVAALDRDLDHPSFLSSELKAHSNYGRRIHIAAVGKDVFSTLTNGKYGELTGTSQAAPQVAAVASLLLSKFGNLKPIEIKNRLIYCSDLRPSLQDQLFGGRLNAECTLDGESGRMQFKGMTTTQHGRLAPNGQLHFVDSEGSELNLSVRNTRAIHYDTFNETYTVFYTAKNRTDSTLLRASNMSFRDDNETLQFQPDGGPSTQIKVSQISRYTSPVK